MKFKLNWVLGEETINNRKYDVDNFIKELEKIFYKGLFVYRNDEFVEEIKDNIIENEYILGKVKNYKINNRGEVIFDINIYNEDTEEYINEYINKSDREIKLTNICLGEEEKGIVYINKFLGLFFVDSFGNNIFE